MLTQYSKDMERLMRALELCRVLHKGQTDKCGQPYWIHPFTVGMRSFTGYGSNLSYCIVGMLHDIAEDTEISVDVLKTLIDLTDEEVQALRLLTRQKHMSYDKYIDSIIESGNEVAMVIKLDDLMHNCNLNRMIDAGIDVTEKDMERTMKYNEAFHKIHAKLNEV